MACHVKNLLEFLKKIYPGYLLEIGLAGFVDTLLHSRTATLPQGLLADFG